MILPEGPFILIMVGAPGSGKSTWLSQRPEPIMQINSDIYVQKYATDHNVLYQVAHGKMIGQWQNVKQTMFFEKMGALAMTKNIAIDRPHYLQKHRYDSLYDVPKDYMKIAVVMKTSREVCKERVKKRKEETGRHVPDWLIDEQFDMMQPIQPEEEFNLIIRV